MTDETLMEEVAEISVKRNIENLKSERERYIKNIDEHEKLLDKLNKDRVVNNKKYDAIFKEGNFVILSPTWKFEQDEDYLAAIKMDFENKKIHDEHLFDQNENQIKQILVKQHEALDSVESELKRLEGENHD